MAEAAARRSSNMGPAREGWLRRVGLLVKHRKLAVRGEQQFPETGGTTTAPDALSTVHAQRVTDSHFVRIRRRKRCPGKARASGGPCPPHLRQPRCPTFTVRSFVRVELYDGHRPPHLRQPRRPTIGVQSVVGTGQVTTRFVTWAVGSARPPASVLTHNDSPAPRQDVHTKAGQANQRNDWPL